MSARPYQNWTRKQISERLNQHQDKYEQVNEMQRQNSAAIAAHDEGLWLEEKKLFGGIKRRRLQPNLEHSTELIRLSSIGQQIAKTRSENARDVQALELEIHIRDTPDLLAEFGPGAD